MTAEFSAVDLLARHTLDAFGLPRNRYDPDREVREALAEAQRTGQAVATPHNGYVIPMTPGRSR